MIVAGIVLAAGAGTRLGGPKATAVLDGERLVDRAVRTMRAGGCDLVIAVLGAAVVEVPGADLVVVNAGWATGMGSSLRTGLDAARHAGVDAVVVALVDQPWLGAGAVARVVEVGRTGSSLARASYQGQPAHPVLIGAEHWDAVAAAAVGDRGAGPFLAEHADQVLVVSCDGLGDPADLDTPEDWARRSADPPWPGGAASS